MLFAGSPQNHGHGQMMDHVLPVVWEYISKNKRTSGQSTQGENNGAHLLHSVQKSVRPASVNDSLLFFLQHLARTLNTQAELLETGAPSEQPRWDRVICVLQFFSLDFYPQVLPFTRHYAH